MSGNPEMPAQRHKAGRTVGITAPTAPVRGHFRRRPWPIPPSSVACAVPKPGAHGRIADDDGPEARLAARPRWSAAFPSARGDGL
jgi:hypothetical protein